MGGGDHEPHFAVLVRAQGSVGGGGVGAEVEDLPSERPRSRGHGMAAVALGGLFAPPAILLVRELEHGAVGGHKGALQRPQQVQDLAVQE